MVGRLGDRSKMFLAATSVDFVRPVSAGLSGTFGLVGSAMSIFIDVG